MFHRLALGLSLVLALAAPASAALCTANAGGVPVACRPPIPLRPQVRITRDGYGVPHNLLLQADATPLRRRALPVRTWA